MMKHKNSGTPLLNTPALLAAAGLIGVFIVDMTTPVYLAVDILYLCCTLLIFKQNSRTIIGFSIAAGLLILLDSLAEVRSLPDMTVWINRMISIGAIFIVTYISLSYRKASRQGLLKEEKYLRSLEEMNFITSHQVRKPVANIMGLVDIIHADHDNLSVWELRERCNLLKHSAAELDDCILELNNAIRIAEEEQKGEMPTG